MQKIISYFSSNSNSIIIDTYNLEKKDRTKIMDQVESMLEFFVWKKNNDNFIYKNGKNYFSITPHMYGKGFHIEEFNSLYDHVPYILFSSREKAEQFIKDYDFEDIVNGLFPYYLES